MRVIFAYKNFAAYKHISHIGLGVSALNTAKVLNKEKILSEVWPILDANHLRQLLNLDSSKASHACYEPITHVVIAAPWIPTTALAHLCQLFPTIVFAVNCHSNVGFLQADPNGMRLLREDLDLEMCVHNFHVAANSKKLKTWLEDAYGNPCTYLPNLYSIPVHRTHRPHYSGDILRIGCFGAIRPQKNLASAVAAAIEIGHQLKKKTEIWISSGRFEGGGSVILNTVREMCKNLPTTTLHEGGWHTWPSFRRLVSSMHLLLQPSYTESFNMVTADGVSEGVPSVVGEAIDWVPESWVANVDDVFDIAHKGIMLLHHPKAAEHGLKSLVAFVDDGLKHWKSFLNS